MNSMKSIFTKKYFTCGSKIANSNKKIKCFEQISGEATSSMTCFRGEEKTKNLMRCSFRN